MRAHEIEGEECLLLTFEYDSAARHMLVNLGCGAEQTDTTTELARWIRERCGGSLAAVLVTRRRRCALGGFTAASGDEIAACKPAIVLLPWTEAPEGSEHTTALQWAAFREHVEGLRALCATANSALSRSEALGQRFGSDLAAPLEALVAEGRLVEAGITRLRGMAGAVKYLWHGRDVDLSAALPGVEARGVERGRVDPLSALRELGDTEYWGRIAMSWRELKQQFSAASEKALLSGATVVEVQDIPPHARWFCRRVEAVRAERLLQQVSTAARRHVDDAVAIEITVGRTRLLVGAPTDVGAWWVRSGGEDGRHRIVIGRGGPNNLDLPTD